MGPTAETLGALIRRAGKIPVLNNSPIVVLKDGTKHVVGYSPTDESLAACALREVPVV